MKEVRNITGYLISTTYKVFPVPSGSLEVPCLLTFSVKSETIIKLMKSFVNDLHDSTFNAGQAENNNEESGDNNEIDIKLTGEENATNENSESFTEINLLFMYTFLFQIVLDLKTNAFP